MSARLHAPSLAPYVVYLHRPHEPFAADPFVCWLQSAGVRVLRHRLSFHHEIPPARRKRRADIGTAHLNLGAYGRLDVPRLVTGRLLTELQERKLSTEQVLYTDTDVLFADDVDLLQQRLGAPLRNFAAGTEYFSASMNSGVMLMNTSAFIREWPGMLSYAVSRKFRFLAADQSWIHEYFTERRGSPIAAEPGWEALSDELYNARAFAHPLQPRRGAEQQVPRVWHWHGYKPHDVKCWLDAMRAGRWPLRGWRDETPNCRRGRCRWKPIIGSGCRYFGRISLNPCYLRTYTYLLMQHLSLLQLADQLVLRNSSDGYCEAGIASVKHQ